jgi:hypothetical protein
LAGDSEIDNRVHGIGFGASREQLGNPLEGIRRHLVHQLRSSGNLIGVLSDPTRDLDLGTATSRNGPPVGPQ